MNKLLLVVLFLAPISLYAQVSIKGKVVSDADGTAIPRASVFLSNTGVGNTTEKDGSFVLGNVKNGRYQLVVTCIGYAPHQQSIVVNDDDINLSKIKLSPKINQLSEVKVKVGAKPESKSDRNNYLRMFIKAFLGDNYNAAQCNIINPDIIEFSYNDKKGELSAATDDFLIIENRALGYRVKYLLEAFVTNQDERTVNYVGVSAFEPMKGDEQQQEKWTDRRERAYRGSAMHFFRSCVADAVNENEFSVYAAIRPELIPSDSIMMRKIAYFRNRATRTRQNADSLQYWTMMYKAPKDKPTSVGRVLNLNEFAKLTNKKRLYAFGSKTRALLINYQNKTNYASGTSTYISFIQPNAFFDSNGVVFTPANVLFEGNWSKMRVADQLPVDYEPRLYEAPMQASQTVPDGDK